MQTKGKYFFTSESVTEGHPDKVADQISDAVLDTLLAQDSEAHVACETLVTTGMAVIAGEISTRGYADLPKVVRDTIKNIGYNSSEMGFDWQTCAVISSIDHQSPDIAQGVLRTKPEDQGAGDQGMMFGYACNETATLMPAPIYWAHQLSQQLARVRKDGIVDFFRPDGKTQVSFEYQDGKPVRINNVVVSTQHAASASQGEVAEAVKNEVIRPILGPSGYFDEKDCEIFINTTGVGEIFIDPAPSGHSARPGDAVLISGAMGDHGLTVMGSRENLSFLTDVASDSAPLNRMIEDVIAAAQGQMSGESVRFEDILTQLEEKRQALEKREQEADRLLRQREEDARRAREFREQMERAKDNARSRGEAEAKRILRDARTAADQVFQELSEMRKAQAKAERMLNENEARAALRRTLNEAEEAVSRRDARQEPIPKPSRPIRAGDLVEIPGVKTPAEVVSVGKDGTLQLKAGILKMKAKVDEVRLIEDDERAARKKTPSVTIRQNADRALRASAARELDIRGMETLEAESVVENFISAAVMGKLETVTIIHGKGTGALRKAVHDILRRNKAVKSFRLGVYGEGESGVTVVTLK